MLGRVNYLVIDCVCPHDTNPVIMTVVLFFSTEIVMYPPNNYFYSVGHLKA